MKLHTILLVFLILVAAGVVVAAAKADGSVGGTGQQVPGGNQTQDQLHDSDETQTWNETDDQLENRTREQEKNRTQVQAGELDRDRLQNQTRAMNVTELHQQIQERRLEQEHEWIRLPSEQRNVNARYSNVSAFVHLLLNESRAEELLGGQPGGIGQEVAAYAREFNNSVAVQVRAEERIENRNAFVRFIAGGDEEAAAELENETARNRERIAAMRQLIQQYQGGDPEIKAAFQEQLREMEAQQDEVRQRAAREREDRGIIGWLWK